MRFTDTFLRQVRDRVSIADYAGKRLTWDKRKSRPAGGDFWACCPFHNEKSSSFHVLDQKGIFKCFGCGESGDAFTLAMRLEGLSFPEAVAKMADLAGMALPADELEDRGENDRRKRLFQAAARAAKLYAEALTGREGREAREYLLARGFDAELCTRFGIGFAPGGYTWLIDKLKAESFTLEELVAAGLARDGEEGRRAIDTFRERITFEITDTSGKVIAFGGRALKKDEKAKYINSPECDLYSKGRVLYRLKQAREILAKTKAGGLVVGEGYLDVIAFERAGIAAVAPCGTSLTEDQLQLLWRAGGEPVFCFDGDIAGKRAADRALDLALPHLGPGRTLKVAQTPAGEDPDDVFRRAGAEALNGLLAAAQPASTALFEREKARGGLDTPEARAAFKANLREAAQKIADPETRKLYLSDLLSRADAALRGAWKPASEWKKGDWKSRNAPLPATAGLIANVAAGVRVRDAERFLRAVIDHPALFARVSDWIDRLALDDPDLDAIRAALLAVSGQGDAPAIDRAALTLHLSQSGYERAAARLSRWPRPAEGAAVAGADLEAEWLALVTRDVVLPAIKEELAELRLLVDAGDDAAFARFQALVQEARAIEARALEVKLEDATAAPPASDDLVAH